MGASFYLVFGGIVLLGIVGIGAVAVILIRALMKHVHGVEPSKLFASNPGDDDAPPHRAGFTETGTPSAGTGSDLLAPALAAGAAVAVADALLPETEPCSHAADFSSRDEGSSQCDASSSSSSDDSGSSSSSD